MPLSMRDDMPPFITGENAHIPMTDGSTDWLVVVTREAMEDVAAPPEISMDWLMVHRALFGKVASYKLDHGRAGSEGTVWVQSEDVLEWKAQSSGCASAADVSVRQGPPKSP
ncbi:hypothetical protein AB4Z52_31570 [Rhizobium sp. 2YAF20]|uniref:hypothetical protein n=1 Tax=Rhizobium sp. 2YAF20 TaxID=3233027 RepID=UPI003F986152